MRYLVGYGYLFLVFVVITIIQKLFSLHTGTSRKLIHTGIGYTWVILYRYFYLPSEVGRWELLVMPISFIVINLLSYRYKIFTVVEREGKENHPGTVYYAIAITVLMAAVLIYPPLMTSTGIAVFCLSFGDGLAALVGEHFGKNGPHIRQGKSLVGTLSCFVGAVLGTYLLMLFVPFTLPFYAVLLIGAFTAICELCGKGTDNFSISFGVTALSYLLLEVTV